MTVECFICGVGIIVHPATNKHRPRKTCSQKCRKAHTRLKALAIREEQKYTKRQLDKLARNSPEYDEWRKQVFERDDYTCQFCGKRGGYIEADHIKPFAYFPELRYELSNGRTLCRPCHDTTKIGAKAMRELYGVEST